MLSRGSSLLRVASKQTFSSFKPQFGAIKSFKSIETKPLTFCNQSLTPFSKNSFLIGGRAFSTSPEEPIKDAEIKTPEAEKEKEVLADNKEKVVGQAQQHEFQAETRKLLDIVARSLYTDKEVFIRELISNASDATEKLRHKQLVGEAISDSHLNLELNIYADSSNKTLTIQDHGIGMSEQELVKNLGSIGFSGSLEYIKNAKDKDLSSIIGQFGVGFYSSFMVGDRVTVYSKSAAPDAKGYCWKYDGTGSYKISEAEGVERGTKIVIDLNDKSDKFSQKDLVEKIIQKYSNFVGFPIKLNGKQVNTLKPLWTMSKGEVTEKDHKEFYQFISHSYDNPYYHLHFSTDSPLSIRSLFYIGEHSGERFGMGRMDLGVNLFSRKVLIQAKAKGILPEWLRFVKGVVDSEDIPLNLSREHLQDSALIQRINTVLTKRILKWLDDESHRDPDKYAKFFEEFGDFLREGLFAEAPFREEIGKLLRFESSNMEAGKLTSLEEYVNRMPADQKDIFYVVVPNRNLAESSPYYETFKSKGIEVLFSYNTRFDDYALNALADFKRKPLTSIESSKAISAMKDKEAKKEESDPSAKKLSEDESKELIKYMKDILGSRVSSIKESDRLVDSPAIITDHETAAFRRMVRFVDPARTPELGKQHLEINPKHEIIVKLNAIRTEKPNLSKLITEQVFDDALIAAGLLDDSRLMLPRINRLIATALKTESDIESTPAKKVNQTKEKKEEPIQQEKKQE